MKMEIKIEKSGPLFEPGVPQASIQRGLDSFVSEVVTLLEASVREGTPVGVYGAQGGLLAGIHGEAYSLGTPQVFGVVGHQSVYGDVVELGRRPGPISADGYVSLTRWVEVKFSVGHKEAIYIATAIAHKIRKRGFKGAFMFQQAFKKNEAVISEIAAKAGVTIAQGLGGKG